MCPPGSSPQFSKGTYLPVFPGGDRQGTWTGRVLDSADNVVTMGVTPAPDCIVGKYSMFVAVVTPYGIRRTRREESRNVYVLFNPWVSGSLEARPWDGPLTPPDRSSFPP